MVRQRKYNNKRVEVDGHIFDSQKEGRRYQELLLLSRGGVIRNLRLQPRYEIVVNGRHIANYFADFEYEVVATGKVSVEDVKVQITKTPVYRMKKKLVEAIYGISIVEV